MTVNKAAHKLLSKFPLKATFYILGPASIFLNLFICTSIECVWFLVSLQTLSLSFTYDASAIEQREGHHLFCSVCSWNFWRQTCILLTETMIYLATLARSSRNVSTLFHIRSPRSLTTNPRCTSCCLLPPFPPGGSQVCGGHWRNVSPDGRSPDVPRP